MSIPQREYGDSSWASSGRSRFSANDHTSGTVGDRIGGMFDRDRKNSLPMYKDKPFSYPSSGRNAPWFKRKRVLAGIGLSFLAVFYWLGVFSTEQKATSIKPTGSSSKSWFIPTKGKVDWAQRQERVKEAFQQTWSAYEKHAWGYDEFHPVSKTGRQMVPNGMGWIIVDALDTIMLMNLTKELTHAREWVSTTLTYDQDHDVNTFETTIRMLGGLLSAHYLSSAFPKLAPVSDKFGDDLYLERATDLADRLLAAYNSQSGVPYASVNLHTLKGIPSHDDGGASSTAEATSLQLEMKYLAKLTGETHYWEAAEKVMKVVDDNGMKDGLLPIFIYADQGHFRGNNIRLGSRGDSYYEYLIKQYLQTTMEEPVYNDMWEQAMDGIKKHLITYSSPSNLTVLGERPNGLDSPISPKMDHLVCFMPGTIALGATHGKTLAEAKKSPSWGARQEADMELARQLTKTCWGMYKVTATKLAPEIAHLHLHQPPVMMEDQILQSPEVLSDEVNAEWHKDYEIKGADAHNLQRPETIETLFYMYRITGDEMYREWGWQMFEAFVTHTIVNDGADGYSSIDSVEQIPTHSRDNMESFWLAETLKYFYLLFGPDDVLPLTDVVFNTEAHAFPKFELGKLFKTGWARKPRDKEGNIIPGRAAITTTIEVTTTKSP
ncbi:hypothetical protein MBLNU457_7035t3 [Dothideomycetes sp. NU457]